MSVYGTDVQAAPPGAFLACRLHGARLGARPSPRHQVSAEAYALRRPSTWPPPLRSTVPPGFTAAWTGRESSPAGHRLRLWGLALGPASPGADCHGAGTLGLPVRGVLTRVCAYSFRHPHFPPLHPQASARASPLRERSPTPESRDSTPSFGGPLNPDHSRRDHAGPVSYYALFKGVAASKPTSRLSRHDHILRYTQRPLRGLSCGSGFFPSRRWTLSLSDCLPRSIQQVFGVWLGLVGATPPRAHPVALPPANTRCPHECRHQPRGSTSIDFGENQLSPGLIGLSPLPTSHPSGFQPTPVRASTRCYPSFTLLMGRSPWLRVYPRTLYGLAPFALVTGLAFAVAPQATCLASRPRSNSPDHNAKGTQSGTTDVAAGPPSYRL